jgi:cobalt/nickel transport system permease protein
MMRELEKRAYDQPLDPRGPSMHIPDAVLSPGVAAATYAVAAGGLGYSLKRLEDQLRERATALMGVLSAFVFAAQMVNFPIGPLPISGHLLGGVLAAVLLGPWAGAVVIGAVLIVQCLLFGDGGLTALGANFVNMGLIGAVGGYAIYAPIRRAIGGRGGVLIGAMVAAWFSVLLAAGAFSVELAASGRPGAFFQVLGWMALVHAAIGLGEAIITGLVLRFVLLTRPDLVPDAAPGAATRAGRWGQVAIAGLGIALAVAVFLAPLASEHPDGLEWVGGRLGFLKESPSLVPAPIAGYEMPGLGHVKAATAVAGLVGTLVVFAVGLGLARGFARKGAEGIVPDAA